MMNSTCTHTNQHTPDAQPIESSSFDEVTGIIPFADEAQGTGTTLAVEQGADTAERDTALEAFGPVATRESVADRELGISQNPSQRQGKYACPCCGGGASRVMRVRIMSQPGWSAVCAVCAANLLARVPGTIVGGMVRPTRRRRKAVSGSVAHGFRCQDQGGYRRAG